MTSVAEPSKPPAMYDWFVSQREAMGLTIVPLGADASRVLLRTLRAGKLVGLLCDRDIVGNGIEVEFFGERTTMPAGPAMLALRTGAVLLPTAVYSGPGLDHTAVIMAPVDAAAPRWAAPGRGACHPADRRRPRAPHPPGPRAMAPLPAQLAE